MTLVLQPASAAQAAEAARLGGATSLEQAGERAWRLRGGTTNPALLAYAQAQQLDLAAVAEDRRFADLKLVAMDMDSTLITIECIDELGALAGKQEEIAALTARAMRGEIDYRDSLRRRVALLKGLPVEALQQVYDERLRLTPGAEALVEACHRHGVKLLLVSGGFRFFTERLKARLGLDYTLSNDLQAKGGKLTGKLVGGTVDAAAKATLFRVLAHALGTPAQSVAIGDGANDLPMMALAGTSVAFRAKPVVQEKASCALNYSGLDGVIHLFE